MKGYWLFIVCIGFCFPLRANDVRIVGEVKVVQAEMQNNIAPIEFTVEWENSWRDDYNHDGVYLFLKYKRQKGDSWQHVFLQDKVELTAADAAVSYGYTPIPNSGGANRNGGIIVYRAGTGNGISKVRVRVYWDVTSGGEVLTGDDITKGALAASGIEMVYIPQGAFRIGDTYSRGTFRHKYSSIPAEYDIVNDSYDIVTKGMVVNEKNPPAFAANRVNDVKNEVTNAWVGDRSEGQFWRIDFKTRRKVKYIAIESLPGYVPAAWELYGMNSVGGEEELLYKGTAAEWNTSLVRTYPASRRIKVKEPMAPYQYYEIRFTDLGTAQGPAIKNVAMSDMDLDDILDNSVLITEVATGLTEIPGYGTNQMYSDEGDVKSGQLSEKYPNGFAAFYTMKYELSQEQYVSFLNKLTLRQQAARTIGETLTGMKAGEFVFGGDKSRPSFRNGIVVASPTLGGQPVVFANDLNADGKYSQEGDGQTLACNYLTPEDMRAYADWCGLRPLTELEYEKMCRRPFPDLPVRGEYPWNDTTFRKPSGTLEGIVGDRTETPSDGNANAGQAFDGPLRTGAFARQWGSQQNAGAGFWSVMDLAGNLAEIYYNADSKGRGYAGAHPEGHGAGRVDYDGNAVHFPDVWPPQIEAFALKGGSFLTTDPGYLSVSDRTLTRAFDRLNDRRKEVGFRLGCSAPVKTAVARILLENGCMTTESAAAYDTVCSGGSEHLKAIIPEEITGRYTIAWYWSGNQGKSWDLVEGEYGTELLMSGLTHPNVADLSFKEYWYKMQVFSDGVDAASQVAVVRVLNSKDLEYKFNRMKDTLRVFDDAYGIEVTTTNFLSAFEWWCVENNRMIHKEEGWSERSLYRAKKADLRLFDEEPAGTYHVYVQMSFSQRCAIRKDVEIYAQKPSDVTDHIRIIKHTDGYRLWENGTFAASAAVYRNPQPPYYYEGDTGNGVYQIRTAKGEQMNLYCKMEEYSGKDQPIVAFEKEEGYRLWGDGTLAASVKAYRHPAAGYAYAGCTGNGLYKIAPVVSKWVGPSAVLYADMEHYVGTAEPVVALGKPDSVRIWGDGTLAASIKEYKNPKIGYGYDGYTGTATYRIAPVNTKWVASPADLYCDMVNYSGNVEPIACLGNASGDRLWGDGTLAASAKEYKNPGAGYGYTGSTGNGVYRVAPANTTWVPAVARFYCLMTNYTGTNQPIVQYEDANGYRLWGDGTLAKTMLDYKNPAIAGYAYTGNTGTGLYKIAPENACYESPLIVWCDWSKTHATTGQPVVRLNSSTGERLYGDGSYIDPFENSKVQNFTGNGPYQITSEWGSSIPKVWSLVSSGSASVSLNAQTGVLTGTATGCDDIVVSLKSTNCPDFSYQKTVHLPTKSPFDSQPIQVISSNGANVQITVPGWNLNVDRKWGFEGDHGTLTINSRGVLSGLEGTMCNNVVVTVENPQCPGYVFKKRLKEYVRNYGYTGGIKTLIVYKGIYKVETWGARGGASSSSYRYGGAYAMSRYGITEKKNLSILVGGYGGAYSTNNNGCVYQSGGGGGGSFVVEGNTFNPVCIAGGGGGNYDCNRNYSFAYGQAGQQGGRHGNVGATTVGYGGLAFHGSGGGGLLGDGGNANGTGGKGFKTGGGAAGASGGYSASGGFGGGGGTYGYNYIGGGGGGGYTGGSGGQNSAYPGGGGGSFYIQGPGQYPWDLYDAWQNSAGYSKGGNEQMPSTGSGLMTGSYSTGYVRITWQDTVPIKIFTDPGTGVKYRAWADSDSKKNYPRNALEYRYPRFPYMYVGDIGDGVYRIDPDGPGPIQPYDVYCNMTLDGGGWMLAGKFSNNDDRYWSAYKTAWTGSDTKGDGLDITTFRDEKTAVWSTQPVSYMMFQTMRVPNKAFRTTTSINNQTLSNYFGGVNGNQGVLSGFPRSVSGYGHWQLLNISFINSSASDFTPWIYFTNNACIAIARYYYGNSNCVISGYYSTTSAGSYGLGSLGGTTFGNTAVNKDVGWGNSGHTSTGTGIGYNVLLFVK